MRVLYVTSDYSGVHKALVEHLADEGLEVVVFVALSRRLAARAGDRYEYPGVEFRVCALQDAADRLLYGRKIGKTVRYLLERADIDWARIDVIHAATCCVEGAVARRVSRLKGIPYVVALRNTDVNAYFRYMVWRRPSFGRVLRDAARVVLVAPSYGDKVRALAEPAVRARTLFVPNGLNADFLASAAPPKSLPPEGRGPVNVVYAGEISPNKNLLALAEAVADLRGRGRELTLTLIGKGRRDHPATLEALEAMAAARSPQWLRILPRTDSRGLMDIYARSHIFAMVSHHETFGLVYLEALSRRLPILHSRGEGIDGVFPAGEVGIGACSRSHRDIVAGLEYIMADYPRLQANIARLDLTRFLWSGIARTYRGLYASILSSPQG